MMLKWSFGGLYWRSHAVGDPDRSQQPTTLVTPVWPEGSKGQSEEYQTGCGIDEHGPVQPRGPGEDIATDPAHDLGGVMGQQNRVFYHVRVSLGPGTPTVNAPRADQLASRPEPLAVELVLDADGRHVHLALPIHRQRYDVAAGPIPASARLHV
jgi:hypothetical protein